MSVVICMWFEVVDTMLNRVRPSESGVTRPVKLSHEPQRVSGPSLRFTGLLEEIKDGLDVVHNEKLTSVLKEKDFLVINKRALSAQECLELVDKLKGYNPEQSIPVIILSNALGGVAGIMIATLSGFLPALLLVPAGIMTSRAIIKYGLTKGASVHDLNNLRHEGTRNVDEVWKALHRLKEAGLLSVLADYRYQLTPLGEHLLNQHRQGIQAQPPEGPSAGQKVATPTKLPETRPIYLQRLKCLMNRDSEGTTSGFSLLEKTANAITQRTFLRRWMSNGIREDRLLKALALSDNHWAREQLEKLAKFGFVEKQASGKAGGHSFWKITDTGQALLKEGDPMTNGQINETVMRDILQLEIDRLESEKNDKLGQFTEFKQEYEALERALPQMLAEAQARQADMLSYLGQAQTEPNPEKQKELQRKGRQAKIQYERQESRHRINTQLVERLRTEAEAKEIWMNKWLEQVETTISQLMETQMKTKLLQSHQNLEQILDNLQDIETSQLSSKKLLDAEITSLRTHVQDSLGSALEKASPDALDTHLKVEKALDDQILKTLADEQANTLKASPQTRTSG